MTVLYNLSKDVTSNLRNHIQRQHPDDLAQVIATASNVRMKKSLGRKKDLTWIWVLAMPCCIAYYVTRCH